MNHTIQYRIKDAQEGCRDHTLNIATDQHGLSLFVMGCEKEFVIDLSGGKLGIYITNRNGEVDGPPIGEIEL